jgi:hypothetical protein
MFLTGIKKAVQPPSLRHFTHDELIRQLQFSDNHEVQELLKRFEQVESELEDGLKDEIEGRREWAAACVAEHAGEDHHAEVIEDLHAAMKMNKPEMKQVISMVIEKLQEMDTVAGNAIPAIRDGSAE